MGQCSSAGTARLTMTLQHLMNVIKVFAFPYAKPDELAKVISRGRFLFCGWNSLMT